MGLPRANRCWHGMAKSPTVLAVLKAVCCCSVVCDERARRSTTVGGIGTDTGCAGCRWVRNISLMRRAHTQQQCSIRKLTKLFTVQNVHMNQENGSMAEPTRMYVVQSVRMQA